MDKARDIALQILHDINENSAYANVSLAKKLKQISLSDLNRRFVTELVYGTVKAGGTIDWILHRYSSRPIKKMASIVADILRLGLYQLFYMDKIPNSAACNESVELAKKYGHAGTVKFVNAVMRTAVREPGKADFPSGKGHLLENLSLTEQHPLWLIKKWVHEFGYDDTKKLCDFNNDQAVLSLRTNTLKITREELMSVLLREGAEIRPSVWTPEGIVCTAHPALAKLASLHDGLWQVQDESSMQVAHVLSPQPGEFIIDACSAPGGKTAHIASLMNNTGKVMAFDIYDHKIKRIEDNVVKLGINIVEAKLLDARKIGGFYKDTADRVLVDAPCSGLGVLRRKADSRWRKTPEDIAALPILQMEILLSAAEAVKAGGILVYSTCTMNKEENENVVEAFLAKNKNFVLDATGSFLPLCKQTGCMIQFYPHEDKIDGFFIARLKRVG